MGFISVFLIAVGLAMDAFAVSVSNGIAIKKFRVSDGIKMGMFFGVFQFLMPIIGWLLGSSVRVYIEAFDHWIAFGLLGIIGGNMIKEAMSDEEEEEEKEFVLSPKKLTVQAVATSIDALAVGISFAVLDVDIVSSATIIGVVCFVISFIGADLGKKLGGLFKERAEIVGGIILICIGLKILLEHIL
ncbi:MAG: manganese efflux pump MntP family protein [Anaerotignaceae bacterium]